MNKRQAQRLLNVARALREYEHPERFDMGCYIYTHEYLLRKGKLKKHEDWCGTPGCALGTYASRSDLQRVLRVGSHMTFDHNGDEISEPTMVLAWNPKRPHYKSIEVLDHFGINHDEAEELFSCTGCGSAQTPIEAAKYIENFVARKLIKLIEHTDYGISLKREVLKRVMNYTPYVW